MIRLSDAPVVCPNDPGIWQHINGWEVVAAVLVIGACWASVAVARFHYMAVIARLGNGEPPPRRRVIRKPKPPAEPGKQ